MKKVLLTISSAVFSIALLVPIVSLAYKNPGTPQGFVNDYAGMMSAATRQSLETELETFEKNTGNEIAVVTIPTLDGDPIEDYAVSLFEDWKIGKKDKDNGVLLLISRDDHKMRIEVGYGLEPVITDTKSAFIIRDILTPAFKAGDFDQGITQAARALEQAAQGEYNVPTADSTSGSMLVNGIGYKNLLIFAVFVFMWVSSVLARSSSWWAGGVVGAVLGLALSKVFGWALLPWFVGVLTPLGLIFDFVVSKAFSSSQKSGRSTHPWWIGGGDNDRWGGGMGGGGFGGGGFGGFGGGRSGGGGASGGW